MSDTTPQPPDPSRTTPGHPGVNSSELVVEYLIILADSDTFCNDVDTFNRLLRVDSAITIKGGRLSHSTGVACDYKIAAGEVRGRNQRYFQVQLSLPLDETAPGAAECFDRFLELLKAVRSAISTTQGLR